MSTTSIVVCCLLQVWLLTPAVWFTQQVQPSRHGGDQP